MHGLSLNYSSNVVHDAEPKKNSPPKGEGFFFGRGREKVPAALSSGFEGQQRASVPTRSERSTNHWFGAAPDQASLDASRIQPPEPLKNINEGWCFLYTHRGR